MPGTRTYTCHTAGCSEQLEQRLVGQGRRKVYCTDCCEIRKYGAAIRRILTRRPELHAEAQAQLGASGPRPRRPNGSPRQPYRDKRAEFYLSAIVRMYVASDAHKRGDTKSACVERGLRYYYQIPGPKEVQ